MKALGMRLSINRSVRQVALMAGAFLVMRPASSIEINAAQISAREKIDAAISGVDALKELGVPVPDAADLENAHYVLGLSRYIVGCELAARIVSGWSGIYMEKDEASKPVAVPFDKTHLPSLLLDDTVLRRFEIAAYAAQEAIVLEGEELAPSLNGSSAGAPNTVADAGQRAPRAPKASRGSTASSVRRKSTGLGSSKGKRRSKS